MLEKEFKYYLDHQDELLRKFKDRYVVIKGDEVIGDYPTEIQALTETRKEHEVGTFLIQRCTPGVDDYTETYHSRVVFN